MAELKTKKTDASVEDFLNGVADEQRRADCFAVLAMMKAATGAEPKMWGDSIIGLGSYQYRYESGRALEWFQIGFSPRKQNLTLYIMPGFARYGELMGKLGKYKIGKSCLYINKLSDIDLATLRELIELSAAHTSQLPRAK